MATAKRKRASTSSSPRRRRKSNNQGGKKFTFYAVLLAIGAGAIVFYNYTITPLPLLSSHSQKVVASKTAPKRAFVEPDYQFYTLLPQGNGTQKTVAATTTPTATKAVAVVTPVAASSATPVAAPSATPVAAPNAKPVAAPSATPVAAPNATPVAAASTTPAVKTPAPITVAKPMPPSHHYALQLAAFRNYQDADELKAKLILQGYPTTISSATVKGTVWYRLSIGPYTTTTEAKIVQAKLEKTHLVNHTQVVQQ